MRFIIHELAYERPISAGQLRYLRDDKPTGALESWRLTDAVDGHRFLRVDLDARAAASGHSYLFHLTSDSNGRAIQLKYRFWDSNHTVEGVLLLENDAVIATRIIDKQRQETVIKIKPGYAFWFPATIGLGLLSGQQNGVTTAVTLTPVSQNWETSLQPLVTEITYKKGEPQLRQIKRQTMELRPLTVSWLDQQRTIWLDQHNWPWQMERPDGLTAIESRFVRYQQRII